jgi:DNA-binding response OmpR family regulator
MTAILSPACDKAVCAPTQGLTDQTNRILFVDDSTAVREATANVLVGSGYHVDVAEDGEAGWQALHATKYDLLITDHDMPKLTGVELVKKLRSARMNLPVVLASAALPTEELNRNPWLQIAATLLKPFAIDELLETVKAAIAASAQNLASPVLVEAASPVRSLPQWRSQPPSDAFVWGRPLFSSTSTKIT